MVHPRACQYHNHPNSAPIDDSTSLLIIQYLRRIKIITVFPIQSQYDTVCHDRGNVLLYKAQCSGKRHFSGKCVHENNKMGQLLEG